MQPTAQTNNAHGRNSQIQSIIIIAITLFALAGAILGFSVGALTHHLAPNGQTTNNGGSDATNKNGKATQIAVSPTPLLSPTVTARKLGFPALLSATPQMSTYQYSYTLQAIDATSNTKITTNGVMCRLWITKSYPSTLEQSTFKSIANLSHTVKHEIVDGLTFDPATPQTQPCTNGLGSWNVNLSSKVAEGKYYIVGLTDWNGTFYNWSWGTIVKA